MKFEIKYNVLSSDDGKTVKQILLNKYFMSQALVKRLKSAPDGLMVNGVRVTVRYELRSGDVLVITIREEGSENIVPQKMELDILYEDEYMLAVNKPPYMPTHPSHGHYTDTLSNGVLYYLNDGGESYTIHIVTRLDRNTSGIVLFAKSAYMHDLLSKKLRMNKFEKTYIALCEGVVSESGDIEKPIARCDESIITRCVSDNGSYARTLYKKLWDDGKISLVELTPITGRTHQLRVHMSYIGHPLVGDDLYGAALNDGCRHMLHCRMLRFIHPITGGYVEIEAPLPEEYKKA